MPTISIVIPVYNVENYLEDSLNSILNQTFDDFEVICVDDGSTDNSLEILNDFKNKDYRVKVIAQKNKGNGGARNTGLEYATETMFISWMQMIYCLKMLWKKNVW